jgi:hypothetical protein
MDLTRIKKLVADKRKEKNEVADLLSGVRRIQGDPAIVNDIPLRMDEINSLIAVMQAALETDYDEDFFKRYIGGVARLLEDRFDELQILVDVLVKEKWEREKKPVKAA